MEGDLGEHLVVAVADAQLGHLERDGTRPGRRRQLERAGPLPLVDLGPRRLHPLDPLVERLGLAGPFLGARPHGVGQGREALDLPLLELGRPLALGLVRLVLGLELRVVALPLGEPLVRDVQHLGDGPVEQLEVVADDQEGAGEAGQLVEEPPFGGAVEVVGRLVEDHQVGLLEQDPHEVDPSALATRELVDVLEQQLLTEPEPVGQPGHHRLGLVATVRLELLLQVGEELDVLRGGVVGHRLAGRAQGVVEDVEAAGGEDVREAGWLQPEPARDRGLGQVAERAEEPDVAPVAELRGRLPHQHRDEGRLARPVAPDQAHLLARPHHEGGVGQQGAVTDLDGEGRSDDHGTLYEREHLLGTLRECPYSSASGGP